MAFIPVPNALRLTVFISQGSKVMSTVFHAAKDAGTPFTAGDIATTIATTKSWWTANMAPLLSSSISLTNIVATALDTVNGPQGVMAGATVPGTVAGNMAPIGACACISLYTGIRGRNYRGRVYQGGLPDTVLAPNGMIAAATNTSLVAAIAALNSALGGQAPTTHLVIVSTRLNKAPRLSGIYSQVTTVTARSTVFRYQRRREQDHRGRL